MVAGDIPNMFLGYKKLYEKDPKYIGINLWASATAMANWRYKEAVVIFRQIDPSTINYDVIWKANWTRSYAVCFIRLNRYDEARQIVEAIPGKYPLHVADPLVHIYIRRGQHDSLQLLLNKLAENPIINRQQIDSFYLLAAERYALLKDTVNQVKWARFAIDRFKNNPKASLPLISKSYYLAKEYDNALKTIQKSLTNHGTNWDLLSRLGCIYARLGLPAKAREIIHQIESVKTPYVRGENTYALAEIHAALGEKEKAVDCMKRAYKEGRGMGFGFYAEDFDFLSLVGYEPYEELVKPKD